MRRFRVEEVAFARVAYHVGERGRRLEGTRYDLTPASSDAGSAAPIHCDTSLLS